MLDDVDAAGRGQQRRAGGEIEAARGVAARADDVDGVRARGIAGWRASERMARAKPRSSSAVTPLERSAASNAPASAGGMSPPVSARSSSAASASLERLAR